MSREEFLTKLWIWLSLSGFALSGATYCLSRGRQKWDRFARYLYTFAFITLVVHVGFAYHLYHHWSQDAVYQETARQTAEIFGWNWGGGLYVNYAFMLGWLIDVIWWWRGLDTYHARPKLLAVVWQVFLLFIIFNATVVFASGIVRWLGLGLCFTLCLLWWLTSTSRTSYQPMRQTGDH
ncbi:MAG: hypothetical protein AB1757_11260 [Acidobacteriota bacterium]